MDLSLYRLEVLRQDGEFILYRGGLRQRTTEVHLPSILVLSPVMEHPAPQTVKKIEREASLKDELDPTWAIRPIALTQQQGRTMLVFEDPNANGLDRLLQGAMELREFLRCGIALAAALRQMHRNGLIHKDIKPSNVFVNAQMDQAWLTGFGIASRLPRERQRADLPEFISGTLAYMAPEQTGRMNRSIDSRSDLYALGITLYEMLTGSLPFTASEPLEWVHCHIAKKPIPPRDRVQSIPNPVSKIILKLMAKTPEERYQTAAGVESDFRRCLDDLDHDRGLQDFALGDHDRPDYLQIPEKLYGREREIETLLASFERIVHGGPPELVLVSGYSGIGKSSVVNELQPVLVPPRGLFASGKFDQYKRDVPYSTLAQAFQSLIRLLLTKNETELARWREALRNALDQSGQLIVDLVPELKLIIGDQPPVPEVSPQDAQRRFQLVFGRFIGVFAQKEHPLALFLDDLQWLDAATLDLLEDLLTRSELQHLMLIGAYRDNEVDAAHPLMRKLESIKSAGGKVKEITLEPLGQEHLEQLLADALRCEIDRTAPLAQLVQEKTGGNPFFTIQFISSLAEEGMLAFDHEAGCWAWDLGRIRAKGYTDNVVDLMITKLVRLPAETQTALQQMACLGNLAEITTLSLVLETSAEQVHAALWESVRQGLVQQLDGSYRFTHDRVHEAAYSLIPETSRSEAHLRIGRLLAAHTSPEKREETVFDIVNHLNRGVALIESQEERDHLAELNLIAGKRAKASTAYASALKYLNAGALLVKDGWERRRDLLFDLELHRAECEFLTGELQAADERLTALSNHITDTVGRAALAFLHMGVCVELVQSGRAVAVALEYLGHLGIQISPHPTDDEVTREYERIWLQLGSRTIEDVIDLQLMTDPESLAAVEILTGIMIPAVATDPNLDSLTTCRAVNLSLEKGNCDASCLAYVALGRIALARFGDYKTAFRFGQVGFELVERSGLKRFRAATYLFFATFISPWMQHVRTSVDVLRRAFDAANRIGDLTNAGYANCCLHAGLLIAGDALSDVQREAEFGLTYAQKAHFSSHSDYISPQLALIRTLRGLTPKFGCFDSEDIDEASFERHLGSHPYLRIHECWYWIRKLQARYFAGDYKDALEASTKAQQLLWIARGYIEKADYHFYAALARAASCDSLAADLRTQHLEALAAHHRELENWAENCPENFENRAALVGAEIARIENRDLDAMRLYEKAIDSSRTNGFVHNEGVASERASHFYRERQFDQIADTYLRNARSCYLNWRADGKVRQLDQIYPQLRSKEVVVDSRQTIDTPIEHLDLTTVLKVSQAVSGEIVLEKLINTLLRTAIEHAGAERGLLVLPQGTDLLVQAEAVTTGESVTISLRDIPIKSEQLPETVLEYAARTHESVILEDASARGSFTDDAYIREQQPRSILCLPLVKQGKLIGILYLENNLAANVFTAGRIAVLKVLASAAAISLENSRLYQDLQERERESRMIVDNIPGLVGTLSTSGEVESLNQRLLEYFGKPLNELRDWKESDIIHSADLPRVIRLFGEAISSGQFLMYEARLRRFDGVYRWFQVRGFPARDEIGSVARWYLLITDIDDLKRAETELRALKDRVQQENLVLRDEVDRTSMFEEIIGTSAPLQRVLAQVAKVAPTDSTVLITGETGTGKELIARGIHKNSPRSEHAFIGVNCAAIPRELIASELFGHEKGAFTGATQQRLGRFELASGGTIFLDEVGELPAETQIALLRVLQEREFERVGGTRRIGADVRVIAATNRDLQANIGNGSFRSDLFYRLNVFPIELPPLRERSEDIPLLVEYFIDRYARKAGKKITSINKKTLELLQAYRWPGNIRELQNVIERSVIVCETETFSVDESWLSRPLASELESHTDLSQKLAVQEKEMIEAALKECGGLVSGPSGAAAKLGIHRSTLESKIASLKINKYRFKTAPGSKNR